MEIREPQKDIKACFKSVENNRHLTFTPCLDRVCGGNIYRFFMGLEYLVYWISSNHRLIVFSSFYIHHSTNKMEKMEIWSEEQEIELQHGVFIIKRTLVPMIRVQHVDTVHTRFTKLRSCYNNDFHGRDCSSYPGCWYVWGWSFTSFDFCVGKGGWRWCLIIRDYIRSPQFQIFLKNWNNWLLRLSSSFYR